ncbi:uncharacterized protein PODANS_1_9370 [Podospora anserina S mat+]|uniref:Podospora anserina S mat+ genomic DNA chromosome 1, supercontig 2 n=1 Tax=Podospora anserina (strain S / ATCC MYA-4624 / DSM 980 / FGSC 10383) TaxID=515849 RepID=B2AXZ7_PODAN|nr:uncharacterized protein PODANS_1_9370 [Podospora anserina S mat+]CAP69271.1 unnamed protein product [Podospora anserina S mat+]
MATQTTIPPPILSATSPADIASTCETFALSREEFDNLHRSAKEAKSHSYSPYSKFRVMSHPAQCAPPFCKAVTTVHPPNSISWASKTLKFKAIAVATDISPPASPCGMCRQAIREFCSVEIPIIMFDGENGYAVLRLKELLPLSFGPEALGKEDLGRRGDS